MVAAKSVQEWFAFCGGEELGISLEHASIVWDAATKAAEARFTSHIGRTVVQNFSRAFHIRRSADGWDCLSGNYVFDYRYGHRR